MCVAVPTWCLAIRQASRPQWLQRQHQTRLVGEPEAREEPALRQVTGIGEGQPRAGWRDGGLCPPVAPDCSARLTHRLPICCLLLYISPPPGDQTVSLLGGAPRYLTLKAKSQTWSVLMRPSLPSSTYLVASALTAFSPRFFSTPRPLCSPQARTALACAALRVSGVSSPVAS